MVGSGAHSVPAVLGPKPALAGSASPGGHPEDGRAPGKAGRAGSLLVMGVGARRGAWRRKLETRGGVGLLCWPVSFGNPLQSER